MPELDPIPLDARLDLKVGFQCNNRCVFCVQGDKREHIEDRSTENLKEILADERSRQHGVVFTGGEATIREDLVELVRHARDLGYRHLQLQTNGRRISYMPYMRALAEAGLTEVVPAVHGSTAKIHDPLTRAKGSFKQVVQGIRNARACGVRVITNSVVVQDNVQDLPALARLLVNLGSTQVQFAYVHPAGTAEKLFREVVARFPDAMAPIHYALEIVRNAGIPAYTEAVPYCFMEGYEWAVAEPRIPETRVVDRPVVIDDYTDYRWREGKAKGPPCAECSFERWCEGPWHEYPREYGWEDFIPRTDDPTKVLGAIGLGHVDTREPKESIRSTAT